MCQGEGEVESVRQGIQDALARPFELIVFVQEKEGGVVIVAGHVESVAAHGLEAIDEQLRKRSERFRFPEAEGHEPLVGIEGQPGQDSEAGLTISYVYGAEVGHPRSSLDQLHLEHSCGLASEAETNDEHRRGPPPRRRRQQRPWHFVVDQRY